MSTEPTARMHGRRGEVLAGDQLESGGLALDLALDERLDLGVGVGVGWEGHADRGHSRSAFGGQNSASSSVIWSTRRAWRPPSNSVARNRSTISSARPTPTTRAPIDSTLASLCGAGHARGVEVVAQRGADAAHLVGGELLALPAAAEHDADVGLAVADRAADAGADRRVVDRLGRVGAVVDRPRGRRPSSIVDECCLSS